MVKDNSTPSPTFGQQCAEICRQSQAEKRKKGESLNWPEVAEIIDAHDQARAKAKPKSKRAPALLPDTEWLTSLADSPAFEGIPVAREVLRCRLWCENKRKPFSRSRLLIWLGRVERPIGNTNGTRVGGYAQDDLSRSREASF